MRLLLDEHYTREIARKLRELGHDVVAVQERRELIGLGDEALFEVARTERRALVTENWHDFARLVAEAAEHGVEHYGVVVTSARRLPRAARTVGLFVQVLDELLRAQPREDALLDAVCWLP